MDLSKLLGIVFKETPCLKDNNSTITRVYKKNDQSRKPTLCCYIELKELGEIFYYLDNSSNCLVEISKEELDKSFNCFIEDLRQSNGKKPWDKGNTITKGVQMTTVLPDRGDES